jgi:hypothetical protein
MVDYTDEEWDHIAREWRKAAGMDNARLNAPAFVRWLKHSGYIRDYVCVPDAELPGAEGKYEPDEGRIYYRNSTWQGALNERPHDVWTLVHEGCHAILRHKETRLRASNQLSSKRSGRDEVDTNRLTASILAPFEHADFEPGMSTDYIARKFGLSRPAAEKRLEEFGRMYRKKHGLRRELPPGIYDFLAAQKRKGFKITSISDASLLPPDFNCRYEGEPCPCCKEFRLIRVGLHMTCDNCQARTGED